MAPIAIPSSIEDSLMAHLDRLSPVREVAQIASVLGRTFSQDLLAAAATLDEAAYGDAIAVARVQHARLLELRAATGLARLWSENGKRDAAQELLAPIYQAFTEGFDIPDLKDANALLDELA